MTPWCQWAAERALYGASDPGFYEFLEYLFVQQWAQLKEYAHAHGVLILGDIPIYVSPDSADVAPGARPLPDRRNRRIHLCGRRTPRLFLSGRPALG